MYNIYFNAFCCWFRSVMRSHILFWFHCEQLVMLPPPPLCILFDSMSHWLLVWLSCDMNYLIVLSSCRRLTGRRLDLFGVHKSCLAMSRLLLLLCLYLDGPHIEPLKCISLLCNWKNAIFICFPPHLAGANLIIRADQKFFNSRSWWFSVFFSSPWFLAM